MKLRTAIKILIVEVAGFVAAHSAAIRLETKGIRAIRRKNKRKAVDAPQAKPGAAPLSFDGLADSLERAVAGFEKENGLPASPKPKDADVDPMLRVPAGPPPEDAGPVGP